MKRLSFLAILAVALLSLTMPAQGERVPVQRQLAGSPSIGVSPASGKPEESFTINGSGFNCHGGKATVDVSFDGASLNGGSTSVACDGTFSVTGRVPSTATLGAHTITARGFAPKSAPATAAPTDTSVPTTAPTTAPTTGPTTGPATAPPSTSVPPTTVPTTQPTAVPPTAPPPPPTGPPTQVPTVNKHPYATPPTLAPPTTAPTGVPTSYTIPTVVVTPTAVPAPTCIPGFVGGGVVTNQVSPGPFCPPPPGGFCITRVCGGAAENPNTQPLPPATYRMLSRSAPRSQSAAAPVFDGDQAQATFTVVAPSAPFRVSQSASCATVPVAEVPASCTIVMTATNFGPHSMDFSHTVTNHLAAGVQPVSASAAVGTAVVSGSSAVWSSFQLAPGQSASASIQVSFTPPASSAGGTLVLSDGLTADAVDVTTGQRYTVSYGVLTTQVRGRSGAGGAASRTSSRTGTTSTAASSTLSGLPGTGGAALPRPQSIEQVLVRSSASRLLRARPPIPSRGLHSYSARTAPHT